jgi:signal transduction histidine kinase/CheY-like chemotaxis protein
MTPPEYTERDRHALEEIDACGVCTPYEKEYIRKDGSRVPVLLGSARFEDSPDEGVCFVVDLTERKKLEQQFLRNQRMESIGTLASGIAHDLNNILAPIMLSIGVLKMKITDRACQELLSSLNASAERGADMVRQILSFARGVEGRKITVQLKHIIHDVKKIIQDTFPKNIRVEVLLPQDLWPIEGDPTQIHQVLLNLCVNARDAMPHGGVIKLAAENLRLDEHYAALNPEARAGTYICLQVEDNGTGMPPEIMDKIFDPFFTTKEIGKGTGLGLATSQGIIKSHGGFIQVFSEVGKGTTFKIHLPAQVAASDETAAETDLARLRGNGELILVVDDEVIVREVIQDTLLSYGYRVLLAADGAEALAVYARQAGEIAVVLTDMMMPVMDGLALAQVLHKMNPRLPIIGASGLAAGDRVQGENPAIKYFLSKPYTAEALLQILRQILPPPRR